MRRQEGATCLPQTDVKSQSECKDAAAALGYDKFDNFTIKEYAPMCYLYLGENGDMRKVIWRKPPQWQRFRAICKNSGDTGDVKNCKEETGMAYFGNNLPNGFGLRVDDKQSCINKCIKRTGCHYWSYNLSWQMCWLKSSDGGRRPDRSYVSGKICGKAEETHNVKNCKEETKMAYFGNNLTNGFGLLVDGKQSCIKKCIERTGCHYWSYRPSDSRCWLKSSDGGRTYNRNYMSGKICGKADSPM